MNKKTLVKKCILCDGEIYEYLHGRDFLYRTTNKDHTIYKCKNCKLEFQNPIPNSSELSLFYPKTYYSYTKKEKDTKSKNLFTIIREKIVEIHYSTEVKKDIYYYLALISARTFSGLPLAFIGKKRFLDVGGGDGYNMELMQKYGWKVAGYEIGKKGKKGNIHYDTSLTKVDFGSQKFDFIRIWHVLEHVPNPKEFMKKISMLTDKGSKVMIGLPNTQSLNASLFRKYWYNRDIPRHVVNYNPDNLKMLVQEAGFTVESISYMSGGGFLGSIQHLVNDTFYKNSRVMNSFGKPGIDFVDNPFLFLLFYPLDILTDVFKFGDVISLVAVKK